MEVSQIIRQALNLNRGILADLPDDLINLAFIRRGTRLQRDYFIRLRRNYGFIDNEALEFFGDAILHMILTEYLFNLRTLTEGEATQIRRMLENNDALRCLMMQRNLCQYIQSRSVMIPAKACADSMEAIIGIVYVYLRDFKHRDDAYPLTYSWFVKTFNLPDLVRLVSQGGTISCSVKSGRSTEPVASKPTISPESKDVEPTGTMPILDWSFLADD
jgi:23S rRNA maturation mini-RNase III